MCVFSFLVAAGFEPMYFSLGSEHLIHYPILTPNVIETVFSLDEKLFFPIVYSILLKCAYQKQNILHLFLEVT